MYSKINSDLDLVNEENNKNFVNTGEERQKMKEELEKWKKEKEDQKKKDLE